jgi:hypothetical protein
MLTIAFISIIVALLFGAGAVPSRALFPEDGAAHLRYAASPVLGFGLLVMAVQTLYLLGFTVRQQAPFLVGAIICLAVADRLWSARKQSTAGGTERHPQTVVLGCGAVAVLLCGWPGIYSGYRTYMAYANPDANNYQFTAERYLNHPRSEKFVLDGFHPGNYNVSRSFQVRERSGVDAYLAWVSAVCDTTTKQGYWIAVCSIVFLIPLSVYVFVILGLDADRRVALLAAGLMATSSLVGLVAFQQLLGNLGGGAVLPAAFGCILACLRKVCIRTGIAAAVLCGALLSMYPEMVGLLGPAVVGAAIFLTGRLGIAQIVRNAALSGSGVVAGALVINPYFGYYGILMLLRQSGTFPGGDSYAFAFTKAILPVTFGLLPFPADTAAGGGVFQAFRISSYGAGALCVVLLGLYAFQRSKDRACAPLLGAVTAMLVLAAYMAFWLHYSYGFFKVILYGEFLLVTALVASGFALWNGGGRSLSPIAKWGGATILLVLAGCNFLSLVWYGAASLSQEQHGIVNEVALSADTSFDDLEGLRHVISPTDSVMLDVHSGIVQMWAAYGLRDVRISLMQPLLYFEGWTRGGATDFTHGYTDRYVLTEARGHRDIIDRQARDESVWRSSRFEVYPFRDYVALGANWYGLERGVYPWRWLNNDGEILLIRPSERRYQIALQCAPGPGVPGSIRHVEVLVNGTKVHDQVTDGVTLITSPLFTVDRVVNRIAVHIVEKAALIPTDSRLLNVGIAKVRVTGEQAAQKLIEEETPTEITVQSLPRYLPAMTGVFSDTWVGPKAEIWLGSRGNYRLLEVEGEVPVWTPFETPLRIGVSINGMRLGEVSVTAKGLFSGVLQVPPQIRKQPRLQISLTSNHSFSGQELSNSGDTRRLSFFFRAIRLKSTGEASRP